MAVERTSNTLKMTCMIMVEMFKNVTDRVIVMRNNDR